MYRKKRKKKRNEQPVAAFYCCLGCKLGKSADSNANKNFKGRIRKTSTCYTYVCGGLTNHLFHKNYVGCLLHYNKLGLFSSNENKVDFATSLRDPRIISDSVKRRKVSPYTPDQIGLTLTANGPTTIQVSSNHSNKDEINSQRNKQLMYNPYPSEIPRNLLTNFAVAFPTKKSKTKHRNRYKNKKKDKDINTDDSDIESNDDLDNDNQTKYRKERKEYHTKGTNSCESEMYTEIDTDDNSDELSSEESYYKMKLPYNNESCTSTDTNMMLNQEFSSSDESTFDTDINYTTDNLTNDNTLRIKKFVPLSRASPQLASEITLMNLLTKYKMPMNAVKTIFDWAKTCQNRKGFDFCTVKSCRRRETIFEDIHNRLQLPLTDKFEPQLIDWLPDLKPATVYHRPFMNALQSLLSNHSIMKEENLSFPDKNSPFSSVDISGNGTPLIEELHHGEWWSRTWQSKCAPGSKEILVPVILYMDGISLDAHGRLTLTPLNMTLGIFNVATRSQRPDAWETIYWHPDKNFLSANHSNTPSSEDNIQNLHNGLEVALRSFKDVCEHKDGVLWDGLPYGGRIWNGVKMKFAIAYVVGDTEQHDRLCGRYICYNGAVSKICRHCNINTEDACFPRKQQKTRLWTPSDFICTAIRTTPGTDYWKSVSHHPIRNAFHNLDFGCNDNNIHMATPGECLHMHQLGVAKRAVESISDFVFGRNNIIEDGVTKVRANRAEALESLTELTRNYGAKLTRQSDRDFPRTKFTSNILQATKKEGSDYAGILLSLIVTLSSDEGKDILTSKAAITNDKIEKLIYTLELVLGMEEFLKHGRIRQDEIPKLKKMIDHFLTEINANLQRNKGMGTNLIKNHLYFHVPLYIKLWGPPAGWDSAPSESNHKTEIKAPSTNTQRNASTFIEQTGNRIIEKRLIERAIDMFGLGMRENLHIPCSDKVGGSKFRIKRDINDEPIMEWEKKENKVKSHHNKEVLQFCCEHVLPLLTTNHVNGFTEHYRIGGENNTQYLFRSNPSFMSAGGQLCNVWYDWALFDVDGEDNEGIPAQIVCLLNITTLNIPQGGWGEMEGKPDCADGYPVRSNNQYAIVRKFKTEAKKRHANDKTNIVWTGKIDHKLYLYPCDSINREIAVVQNTSTNGSSDNFFVIRNRNDWLCNFQSQIHNY